MQKKITLKQSFDRFIQYIEEWEYLRGKLDRRTKWIPIYGVIVDLYWLNKMSKLTKEYGEFLDRFEAQNMV